MWTFTEKVDGTNIRVQWDGEKVTFNGRADRATTPPVLLKKLGELFPHEAFIANELPMNCHRFAYTARAMVPKFRKMVKTISPMVSVSSYLM